MGKCGILLVAHREVGDLVVLVPIIEMSVIKVHAYMALGRSKGIVTQFLTPDYFFLKQKSNDNWCQLRYRTIKYVDRFLSLSLFIYAKFLPKITNI